MGGAYRVEPQKFVDGRSPDVESLPEQSWADKSKGSCTLTGQIETPQILSALLNFRRWKLGRENLQNNKAMSLKDKWKNVSLSHVSLTQTLNSSATFTQYVLILDRKKIYIVSCDLRLANLRSILRTLLLWWHVFMWFIWLIVFLSSLAWIFAAHFAIFNWVILLRNWQQPHHCCQVVCLHSLQQLRLLQVFASLWMFLWHLQICNLWPFFILLS